MINPFPYGRVVQGEDYCPRPGLQKELAGLVRGGRSVVLIGPRRTGKTSLAVATVRGMRGKRLVKANLMAVKSPADVSRRLLAGLTALEGESDWLDILRSLARLRPKLTLDAGTGQPGLTLDEVEARRPESVEDVLQALGRLRARKPVILLDEFQDVAAMPEAERVLALMRGVIQHQSDLPYVFAGSDQHGMHMLFQDPASPFYKSAALLPVGPIEEEGFRAYLGERFETGRRKVPDETWDAIFSRARDNPGDVQQLCNALWDVTERGGTLGLESLEQAVALIVSRERGGYETLASQLSARQLDVLRAMARLGGAHPYATGFIQAVGVTHAGAVKTAVDGLVKKRILVRVEEEYRFFSPFFGDWLRQAGM